MADKEMVSVTKEQLDSLIKKATEANGIAQRLEALEKNSKGPGLETTSHRYAKIYKDGLSVDTPATQAKNRESITVVEEPGTIDGEYVKDKCPFCIKNHAGKPTILDVTNAGKYSCRRCGKHWAPWAIFPEDGSDGPLEYNVLLERDGGDKKEYEAWKKLKDAKAGLPVTNTIK